MILAVMLLTHAVNVFAVPVVYLDEAEFLDAASALGLEIAHEGFEDDSVWGEVRSSISEGFHAAPAITSQGITWTANNLSSGITTGQGPAHTGLYGFYSYPHGSYGDPDPGTDCFIPGDCGDGFRGAPDSGLMYAIGGWIDTSTPYAKLGLFLGNYPENPVNFGETCDPPDSENCYSNSTIGTGKQFFGVIDEAGFERFEYRELEGKLEPDGADIKYIFADDFSFATGPSTKIFRDGFEY